MQRNLNIYAIELDSKWCDKDANLKQVEEYLKRMPANTDIVVLPEMFSTGFVVGNKNLSVELSEKNLDNTISVLHKLSAEYGVAIAGTYLARTNTKLYNRAFFIEPSGDETFYDKRHLFSMGNENETFSEGERLPPIIRFRSWNIMPVICYDLRFPVWCRNADRKYDLMLVMASWPKAREYAWRQLLIARAIENQCYVCGVNRSGVVGENLVFPDQGAMIIDYKGMPCHNRIDDTSVFATLDNESYERFLQKFPVWKDSDIFNLSL